MAGTRQGKAARFFERPWPCITSVREYVDFGAFAFRSAAESGGQASPEVSNIAESIASRADLPAQTTNWNAG